MLGEQASPRRWAKRSDEAGMSWADDVVSGASSSPLQVPSRHRPFLFRPAAFGGEQDDDELIHEPKTEETIEDYNSDATLRFPDTHQGRMASMFMERLPCTGMEGPPMAQDGPYYMHDVDPGGCASEMASDGSLMAHPSLAALETPMSAYMMQPSLEMQRMEEQTSAELQQLFPPTGSSHPNPMEQALPSHFSEEYPPLAPPQPSTHMMVPFPFGSSAPTAFDEQDELTMEEPVNYASLMTPPTAVTMPRTTIVSPMNNFGPSRMMLPPSLHELKSESLATVFDDEANSKFSPDRRKLCCVDDCKSQARAFNRCKRHGGSKRCSHPGCTKSVQSRGLCIRHGGGSRCQENGCTRAAQSHGKCKMHGGGRPCIVPGCEKKAHLKRLCRKHGGGAKCSLADCEKWAQRLGMCMTHSKHQHTLLPSPPSSPVDQPARAFLLHESTSI